MEAFTILPPERRRIVKNMSTVILLSEFVESVEAGEEIPREIATLVENVFSSFMRPPEEFFSIIQPLLHYTNPPIPPTPNGYIDCFITPRDETIYRALSHEDCPVSFLEAAAYSPYSPYRRRAADHPNATEEIRVAVALSIPEYAA